MVLIGYLDKSSVEAVSGFHGLYNDFVTIGLVVGLFQSVGSGLTGGQVDRSQSQGMFCRVVGYVLI